MAEEKEVMKFVGGKVPPSMKRRLTAWRRSRDIKCNESEALRYALELFLVDVPDPGEGSDADADED